MPSHDERRGDGDQAGAAAMKSNDFSQPRPDTETVMTDLQRCCLAPASRQDKGGIGARRSGQEVA